MAWFRDAEVLARMRALIRQYKETPLDQETLEELCGLRRVVAQLWLDVEVAQLQTLHQTAVGAITRALLLAGFGDELLDATDERARRELLPLARDLNQPRAAGHLLALLLFVPLESVEPLSPRVLRLPWKLFECNRREDSWAQPSTDGKNPWKLLFATLKTSMSGKSMHAGSRPERRLLDAEKITRPVRSQSDEGRSD